MKIKYIVPLLIVLIIIYILYIIININCCNPEGMILGLASILLALIPFNYYFSSTATLEFESFTNCNRRFDEMNELLNSIGIEKNKKNETERLKELIEFGKYKKTVEQIILDYLDLCAEEYYLYKYSSIISKEVWKHWLNGMLYYFVKDNIFYKVLLQENKSRNGSYYGFIDYIIKEIEKLSNK